MIFYVWGCSADYLCDCIYVYRNSVYLFLMTQNTSTYKFIACEEETLTAAYVRPFRCWEPCVTAAQQSQ